ncbi:major facilitator superfamily domain-containing protein 12-like [Penaeus indicus]|uniref:major facilitator superfamily domain-containing protein 12-like n=1 Tax=Penaeus indicus TaxID=29960 RepID=UPI00300D6A4E
MALSRRIKFGYGVGHVLNDLCASMWFTYLLVYLQYVLQLDRGLSGFLLMVGQVADAVSTPLVGMQSDRGCSISNYGRRKTWHLIGTICVLVSFPFIFIVCGICFGALGFGYVLLLGFMICLFQFGWASTQVSHLALIPDLTDSKSEREELNLIRYIFDVCSDVLVYLVAWVAFSEDSFEERFIDPGDSGKFKSITLTILVVGTIFSTIFHVMTPEDSSGRWSRDDEAEIITQEAGTAQTSAEDAAEGDRVRRPRVQMTWRDWLTEPQFYQVSMLYACARLVANLANIYMPIYLQETVHAKETMIALIPLVMSLSGVGASFLLRLLRKGIGKKAATVVGIVVGLVASTVSALPWMPSWALFSVAVLWGVSGSLLVILSLTFAADLIGRSTNSSAFVYGSMSFGDKVLNGIAVFMIQELTRVACEGPNCSVYYRHVMSLGIFIPLLLAFVAICILSRVKLGRTRKLVQAQQDEEETSVSSIHSESSEILLSPGTNLGYGAITKA